MDEAIQECAATIPGVADEASVDPVEVAAEARDSLELPDPQIMMSPSDDQPVLVQVPVWLWLAEESWRSQSATAEVPGGEVSVAAQPSTAQWDMGDGTTVTCDGPGVAYDPAEHAPAQESPECGHTYTRSSASEPGGAYRLRAEVLWEVAWEGPGDAGGEFDPLVTSDGTAVTVVESHGLVTGVR